MPDAIPSAVNTGTGANNNTLAIHLSLVSWICPPRSHASHVPSRRRERENSRAVPQFRVFWHATCRVAVIGGASGARWKKPLSALPLVMLGPAIRKGPREKLRKRERRGREAWTRSAATPRSPG